MRSPGLSRRRNIRLTINDANQLLLVGAMAALGSFALVLLTHSPTPGTAIIAGLGAGALAGVVPRNPRTGKPAARKLERSGPAQGALENAGACPGALFTCLAAMAAASAMASAAEASLNHGDAAIRDGRLGEASEHFEAAAALRPWDPDVALLAGQAFVGRSSGGPASGKLATRWSARSLEANPARGIHDITRRRAPGRRRPCRRQEVLAKARLAASSTHRYGCNPDSLSTLPAGLAPPLLMWEKAVSLTPDPEEERAILAALKAAAVAR